MTIGENIKRIRKEKGLTQKKLGQLSGINEVQLRQYELGKSNPKIETILKISNALNVNIAELIPEAFARINSTNTNIIHDTDLLLDQLPNMELPCEIKEIIRKNAITQKHEHQQKTFEMNLLFMLNAEQRKLFSDFLSLNDTGKQKAIEQVEMLTKIPEYQKRPENVDIETADDVINDETP